MKKASKLTDKEKLYSFSVLPKTYNSLDGLMEAGNFTHSENEHARAIYPNIFEFSKFPLESTEKRDLGIYYNSSAHAFPRARFLELGLEPVQRASVNLFIESMRILTEVKLAEIGLHEFNSIFMLTDNNSLIGSHPTSSVKKWSLVANRTMGSRFLELMSIGVDSEMPAMFGYIVQKKK